AAAKSPVHLAASMWILAKYGEPAEIAAVLREHESTWRTNAFVARQVAALLPRIHACHDEEQWVIEVLRMSGQIDALRVVANIRDFRAQTALQTADRMYLLPPSFSSPYPLPKALLAQVVLGSALPRAERQHLRTRLLATIPDPWYRRQLKSVVL